MNKNLLIGLVVLAVIIIGAYFLLNRGATQANEDEQRSATSTQAQPYTATDPTFNGKNAAFAIDGKSVMLVNGSSQAPIANSSAAVTTQYFGNEATGDLNGDGLLDQAFLVTQNTGGSGTFFYVVAALDSSSGYKTTNAVLVGDRIAPQATEIRSGELLVNYADRSPSDSMTAQPSVAKTLTLKVADGTLETAQ